MSDLGAGQYEFIVDIGLYTFSAALAGLAVSAAHVHLGAWDSSVGIIALITPVFFLPTGIDGIYERYLGCVACVMVLTFADLFFQRSMQQEGM